MIITVDDIDERTQLGESLFWKFEMKDLGDLKYFLGIEVLRSLRGIFIFHPKYITDILVDIGMIVCKLARTPIVVKHG